MPYLNLDDSYPEHPKIKTLSDKAYRLHGSAMFYTARWLLDGYLSDSELRDLKGYSPAARRELHDRQLLHDPGDPCGSKHCPPDDGRQYRLHDYLQWNKSREWWEKKRAADAERIAKWRAEQAAKEASTP